MDIYSSAPITFTQAALGGDVRIKTVDGEVEYTLKPGTQTDTRVRLKGKGVPSLRNKSIRGDHYVTLVVQVPTKMNGEQKELLKQFDQAMYGTTEGKEETAENGTKKKGHFGKKKK
jgi:molecular chaperone DnaJ